MNSHKSFFSISEWSELQDGQFLADLNIPQIAYVITKIRTNLLYFRGEEGAEPSRKQAAESYQNLLEYWSYWFTFLLWPLNLRFSLFTLL